MGGGDGTVAAHHYALAALIHYPSRLHSNLASGHPNPVVGPQRSQIRLVFCVALVKEALGGRLNFAEHRIRPMLNSEIVRWLADHTSRPGSDGYEE